MVQLAVHVDDAKVPGPECPGGAKRQNTGTTDEESQIVVEGKTGLDRMGRDKADQENRG